MKEINYYNLLELGNIDIKLEKGFVLLPDVTYIPKSAACTKEMGFGFGASYHFE